MLAGATATRGERIRELIGDSAASLDDYVRLPTRSNLNDHQPRRFELYVLRHLPWSGIHGPGMTGKVITNGGRSAVRPRARRSPSTRSRVDRGHPRGRPDPRQKGSFENAAGRVAAIAKWPPRPRCVLPMQIATCRNGLNIATSRRPWRLCGLFRSDTINMGGVVVPIGGAEYGRSCARLRRVVAS